MSTIVLTASVFVAFGCNKKSELPPPDSPAPSIGHVGAAITEEEAKRFGNSLEAAINGGDVLRGEEILRSLQIVTRIVSGLGLSEKEKRDAEAGAAAGGNNFSLMLVRLTANGGSFKFLRAHSADQKWRALFRYISADGRFGYHDIILARGKDGNVQMEDIYVVNIGEMWSQSMRRLLIPMIAQFKKLNQADDEDYLKQGPVITEMTTACSKKDFDLARQKYESLSTKMQENKTVLVIYLSGALTAGESSEKDLVAGMKRFQSLFPQDPAGDFLALCYHQLKNEAEQALKVIDRIEAAVGGDPYLNAIRSDLLCNAGRFEDARFHVEKGLKEDPVFEELYWSRITISLREKNFAHTLDWLKKLVETCNADVGDLGQVPEYADFVKSPQYREWLEWYRNHKKK